MITIIINTNFMKYLYVIERKFNNIWITEYTQIYNDKY